MAIYKHSEELEKLAEECMDEFEELNYLKEYADKIAYQTSTGKKTSGRKTVFADTELVKEKLRGCMNYKFIITFYQVSDSLDEEHKKRVMFHELLHIDMSEPTKPRIRPHNLEDFRQCVNKWGIDWVRN